MLFRDMVECILWKTEKEYNNYNIIELLPVENVSQIGFKASFTARTFDK
jgi:hypothetical protein